jgi:hypothetical protein
VSLDPDKLAETDDDIWQECAARQKLSSDAEGDNRIRGIKALEFRWGDQWPETARNDRKIDQRPCLTVNHTDVACTRIENTLRQQRPRIKVRPVSDATVDTAAKVAGLIREIESRSNASIAYDSGVAMAKDIGWGYWRIGSEYVHERSFDQQLKILPIDNPFSVYDDPSSIMPAGEDRNWCVIAEDMPRDEYKRLYRTAPNAEYQFTEAPGDFILNWESKTHVRLAEYFRIYQKRDTLYLFSDGSTKLESELNPKKADIQAILSLLQLKVLDKRPTTTREVQWFRLNGRNIVDRRVLPGKYIPVIKCLGNKLRINGKIKRKGMIENLMDPATIFNYAETTKAERYALTPKAPWVAYEQVIEGHPEWTDANRKSYSTLIAKAVLGPDGQTLLPLPQRQNPAQVESGMAEWSSGAERNLMAVAGMPQENPEISARVVSGNKYLQRRQGMQDLTHFQYYDNQTYSIMWTGIILLDMAPAYYDTERVLHILGEDGQTEEITLNEREMGEDGNPTGKTNNRWFVGRYDVVMDTGPGYATKRDEAAENMMELLNTKLGDAIVATRPDIPVRNMDFHGADELADSLAVTTPDGMDKMLKNLPKQAQTIVQSLQSQLQQKDQQIQQMGLELKYGGEIKKMQDDGATKRTLIQTTGKAHDTETKAKTDLENAKMDFAGWMNEVAEWRHQSLVNRDTKLDVAEIQVAGSLLNTHAEAAHNDRAADKAIKAGETDRARESAN